jgi:hypothetical protein
MNECIDDEDLSGRIRGVRIFAEELYQDLGRLIIGDAFRHAEPFWGSSIGDTPITP